MTASVGVTGPVNFDPYDYAFQEDPYPIYARLRDEDPLHHNERHDFWVLSRYADVDSALRDHATYSSAMGVSLDRSAWGPDAHRVMSFLAMDPPRHQRLRSLVSRGFTPRRVSELRPRIQQLTDQYFDQLLTSRRSSLNWIKDFAGKLPMDVISELMGVPVSDRDELRRLADLVVHRQEAVDDVPPAGMSAALDLVSYYTAMLEARRKAPSDDLTSALLEAEIEGDRLRDEEIIAFLFLMVVAGNETTTKLLGNALFHAAAHPDRRAEIFGDPALVRPWVEETLRFDTSSQVLARHLTRAVSMHGRVAPKGAKLIVALGSANRDERVFARADEYDIHRPAEQLSQLISFGAGRHFCLGAHLARLEANIVLDELVRRARTVEVDRPNAVRVHSTNVRGFASLPVEVVAR